MKKSFLIFICCILCVLMCACGKGISTSESAKKNPADTDPRYSLKSQYTSWSGEFAVTYMNVNVLRQTAYYGSEECWSEAYPLVEIVNTGSTPLAMDDFKLEKFILKDDEGRKEESSFWNVYPAILLPGETGYLGGYMLSNTWKKDTELEMGLDISEDLMTNLYEEEDFAITKVNVSELSISNDENNEKIVVTGKINNNSKIEAWINVYVILIDANNIPVCVLNTYIKDVPVGVTVDFMVDQYTYGNISVEDIATYQVVAYAH